MEEIKADVRSPHLVIIGIFLGVLSASLVVASMAIALVFLDGDEQKDFADASNPKRVALGRTIYRRNCADCHGDGLQGSPSWPARNADGSAAAPPHDENGHTWHLSDWELFETVWLSNSDLQHHQIQPAENGVTAKRDGSSARSLRKREIRAVVAFIKSTWPEDIQLLHREVNAQYRQVVAED